MIKFRIFATCFDGVGASIPVTWYGNGSTPGEAIQKMTREAQGNGWNIGAIICVQQRKSCQPVEVAA
nr:MAG TPA: hypothetical protein [Caudoviricetes sp.]